MEKGAQANFANQRSNVMATSGLDDQTIDFRAQMYAAGDHAGAFQGLPTGIYGSPAKTAITKRAAEFSTQGGGTGATAAAAGAEFGANKAGLRTAATMGAKMDTLSTEVQQFAQQALETSRKVNRTNFVPLTKAEQLIESGSSDPDLADFVAANTSLVNAYSAVANRGTPTVAGQSHAYDMLRTATGQEAYERVVSRLLKETAAAKASPGVTIRDIRARIDNEQAAPTAAAQQQAPQKQYTGKFSVDGRRIYIENGQKMVE